MTSDSIKYLKEIDANSKDLVDLDSQLDTIIHLGNISDKIQTGNPILFNQNFSANRIKKMAFAAQSLRNVELKNNNVEFIKKNYKGNWEALKNHKDVKNWSEQNKILGDFNKMEPVDFKLMSILDDKL